MLVALVGVGLLRVAGPAVAARPWRCALPFYLTFFTGR
jgi:hypothetical protein